MRPTTLTEGCLTILGGRHTAGLVARVTRVDGNWYWIDKDDFGRWISYNQDAFTGLVES